MNPSDVKVMKLRRDDACACGVVIAAGETAGWSRGERRVVCVACLEGDGEKDGVDLVPIDIGTPGASLDREYQRRTTAREARVLGRHPRVGKLLLRLTQQPHTTTAFATGADGERIVAERLAGRLGDSVLFLYNRSLGAGGGRGDIDLIVVAATGVWVVDAKKYAKRKIRADRRRTMFIIDGRRHTKLADSMDRQLAAVRSVVESSLAPAQVHGAYCFVEADLPWRQMHIRSVPVFNLRRLRQHLEQPGALDEPARAALHRLLAERLPPA